MAWRQLASPLAAVPEVSFCQMPIPVASLKNLFGHETAVILAFLAGAAAVIGHIHPFFMGFKGGKGFGSYVGMLIGFLPAFGISVFIGASLLTMITNYVALGTVLAVILCPIIVYCYPEIIYFTGGIPFEALIILILISSYIIFKHLKNLKQIFITKDEITFWSVVFKKK